MDKKMIIVDDDPHLLYTFKRIFEDDDMEVMTAESGKECLEILDDSFEGIILMDIMMPEMDGWETVRAIAERYDMKNVIISMLTAKESPDKRREELQRYVVDYIRKPVTSEEIKEKISEYWNYIK